MLRIHFLSQMLLTWKENWKHCDSITTLIMRTLHMMAIYPRESPAKPSSTVLISTISGGDLLALIVSPATAKHPHSTNEIDQAHRHQCHCQTLQTTPEPESPADTTEKDAEEEDYHQRHSHRRR